MGEKGRQSSVDQRGISGPSKPRLEMRRRRQAHMRLKRRSQVPAGDERHLIVIGGLWSTHQNRPNAEGEMSAKIEIGKEATEAVQGYVQQALCDAGRRCEAQCPWRIASTTRLSLGAVGRGLSIECGSGSHRTYKVAVKQGLQRSGV